MKYVYQKFIKIPILSFRYCHGLVRSCHVVAGKEHLVGQYPMDLGSVQHYRLFIFRRFHLLLEKAWIEILVFSKRGIISESIFNSIPSSKKEPNLCLVPFVGVLKIRYSWVVFESTQLQICLFNSRTKGQINRFERCRFSKKTNERIAFFAVKSKEREKSRLFVFWENLERTNLLTVLSDL